MVTNYDISKNKEFCILQSQNGGQTNCVSSQVRPLYRKILILSLKFVTESVILVLIVKKNFYIINLLPIVLKIFKVCIYIPQ